MDMLTISLLTALAITILYLVVGWLLVSYDRDDIMVERECVCNNSGDSNSYPHCYGCKIDCGYKEK